MSTAIIAAAVGALLFFTARKLWKDKKSGKSNCSGCSGCSGCDCHCSHKEKK